MFAFQDRFNRIDGGDIVLQIRERAEGGGPLLPFYYYDILSEGIPVGKISIRIGDNFHAYYNGHVGYEIDPEFQGRGYARRACGLVLDVARAHGMTRIYLT